MNIFNIPFRDERPMWKHILRPILLTPVIAACLMAIIEIVVSFLEEPHVAFWGYGAILVGMVIVMSCLWWFENLGPDIFEIKENDNIKGEDASNHISYLKMLEIAEQAESWCRERDADSSPYNLVNALHKMGWLKGKDDIK